MATVLPFGLSLACMAVTDLMGAVWWPLRAYDFPLIYMIDDVALAARSSQTSQFQVHTVALLLSALGFMVSYEKCQLAPQQTIRLLGFQLDTRTMQTYIPPEKAKRIQSLILDCLQSGNFAVKQMQSLAGMLLALRPAVYLSKLYCRSAYAALKGVALDHRALVPFTDNLVGDLQYWMAFLEPPIAGRPMQVNSLRTFKVFSDASGIGGGAFFYEASHDRKAFQFAIQNWSAVIGRTSSTHREILQLSAAALTVLRTMPEKVAGGTLLLVTDSQSAAAALSGMKGAPGIFEEVKKIHVAAHNAGVCVDVAWESRATEAMQLADLFSRKEDSSQIFTTYDTLRTIAARWGRPTLDVFAGAGRSEHVASLFYTEFPDSRSHGADAFSQTWRVKGMRGEESLAYVFPPSGNELRAINVIAHAILVLPVFGDFPIWNAHAKRRLRVEDEMQLQYRPGLYVTGSRAPGWLRCRKFALHAFLVKW